MKKSLLFLLVVFALTDGAPLEQEDVQSNLVLIPDANGQLILVDLATYEVDEAAEPRFNALADIVFLLYTRSNPTTPQTLRINDLVSVTNSNFNRNHPTRFITHGWNNDFQSEVNTQVRTAYLNRGNFNVIVVDWGIGANTINYISAANRVQQVGRVIAQFCDFLAVSVGVSYETIYLVGHSLGAHASGVAGKNTSRGRIHTIFGLDPAGPLFHMNRPTERIDPDDARYVENIITNGGQLGFFEPIGVSTFYPNWGTFQPGCGIDLVGTCAHGRAYEFFAESLGLAGGFLSTQCIDHLEIENRRCTSSGPRVGMGGEPSNWGRAGGIYWVQTNSASPYSQQ